VVQAAANLNGRLLILHGLMDDNVHVQNSVKLIEELERAGKDFEMLFYPRARHGISGPNYQRHYNKTMLEFIRRTMGKQTFFGLTSR
jgi:dipeptidyl-peptidase-4